MRRNQSRVRAGNKRRTCLALEHLEDRNAPTPASGSNYSLLAAPAFAAVGDSLQDFSLTPPPYLSQFDRGVVVHSPGGLSDLSAVPPGGAERFDRGVTTDEPKPVVDERPQPVPVFSFPGDAFDPVWLDALVLGPFDAPAARHGPALTAAAGEDDSGFTTSRVGAESVAAAPIGAFAADVSSSPAAAPMEANQDAALLAASLAIPSFAATVRAPALVMENPLGHAPTRFQARGAWFTAEVGATGFTFTPATNPDGVAVHLVGADPSARATVTTAETRGFFRAADAGTASAVNASYARAEYDHVYPGIDLLFDPTPNQNLEYSFVVHAGADPSTIRLAVSGATGLDLDGQGNLVLHTPAGNLVSTAPVLFQEVSGSRVGVEGGYELLAGGEVGFRVGDYDHSRALTIDPELNSPPNAIDQEAATDEDAPVNIYWLSYNCWDAELETITVVGATQGSHGSTVLLPDHTVTYTPAANWSGTDTFTYTISDGTSTDTATVTVTVNARNDLPTAGSLSLTTDEDTSVVATLSGTDVEGSTLEFFIDEGPANGTLSEVDGNTVTYVPNGNFNGTDTFTYQAYDGQDLGLPATVTITVNAMADGPGVTITPSGGSTHVSEPGLLPDGEPDSDSYTIVLNTQPTADVTITVSPGGQLQAAPATLTFTPGNWSVAQTVTVGAVDDQVAEGDHSGTVTHTAASADAAYNNISIASVIASVSDDDFAGIIATPDEGPFGSSPTDLNEQGPTSIAYLVQLTSQPTADVTVALAPGSQVTLSTNSLTFTPANWDTAQAVTVTAIDDAVAEGYHEATVTFTASSADAMYQALQTDLTVNVIDNDAPNALPDEVVGDEDTGFTFDVRLNDIDPEWDPLSVTGVTQPAHGSAVVNPDGTVTYTPEANWNGTDSFAYTTSDGNGGSDSGTVTVTVDADNDPPSVSNPGSQTNAEDDAVSLQISASDPEESSFLYTASGLPPGLVMEAMTGLIWGWIDPRAAGTYSASVTVDDFNSGSTTVSFTWNVTDTNHGPHLSSQFYNITYVGESPQYTILPASDIDGDTLTFSVTDLPPGVAYDPVLHYLVGTTTTAGTYKPTVTVADGNGETDSDTFVWHVLPPGTSIPIAVVEIGPELVIDGNITLVHPAAPLVGTVFLSNPSNPLASYVVTLTVTPDGRSTLDTSVFLLRHGESATFLLTPEAISQRPGDVVVHAFVAGLETSREPATNAGVVLPDKVRGPDTPDGMKDRISVGGENWGSYNGKVTVAPNLKGVQSIGLEVRRPEDDDKYGKAAVGGAERLSVAIHAVVAVIGTVQTAPSVGPDGQPDGQGRNANWLYLAAMVRPGLALLMDTPFSVAAIPAMVKMSMPIGLPGVDLTDPNDVNYTFSWGVAYVVTVISDSGDLDGIQVSEQIRLQKGAEGVLKVLFQNLVSSTYKDVSETNSDFHDVAPQVPKKVGNQDISVAQARAAAVKYLKGMIDKEGTGKATVLQFFIFKDDRTGVKDKVIKKSGFRIDFEMEKKDGRYFIRVQKQAEANNGAEKGEISAEDSKKKEVEIK